MAVECMEFIRETKKEICKLGYAESSHIVKIRPECRNGRIRIKGEVREKKGGRYRVVALWEAPPNGQDTVGQRADEANTARE